MVVRQEIESLLGTSIASGPDGAVQRRRVWINRNSDELIVPLLCRALLLAIDEEKCLAVQFQHYERAAEMRDFHERFKEFSKSLIDAVVKAPV
jgi:hypothetical protein